MLYLFYNRSLYLANKNLCLFLCLLYCACKIGNGIDPLELGFKVFEVIVIIYQFYKFIEQKACVQRAGTCFRMELNAEGRSICVDKSFAGTVICVYKA